ncbi:ABC transporter permease subunit [Streptosporangium lutulentum]|uniref:ABC-2 type transport system permease protein n=1 Tax=Streptosporangium lutulentum TaxID=1461250 RepID=A0ABT9QTQ7_9ACTN|nr:ABC transporter permease subunit [Streptosporangium lutulentum]MDP9850066.1 ABC-2 type transport system permease protein [Streptosporangium lutulentum]
MPALVSKSLRDYRRGLIGWTVGIGAFMLLYLSVYSSIVADPEVYGPAALAKFPGAMKDLMGGLDNFTSGAGYLQAVAYQLFGPLLFAMCAVALGNQVIAQPEEKGTLELTLTLPIDRRRLFLERFAALALGLFGVALLTFALIAGMASALDMGVPFGNIAAAHTGLYLLVLFLGTVTATVGAATGRKNLAMAVTGVWAVGGYVVETLGRDVAAVSWLRWLSPFHYFLDGRPVYQGLPVGDYLVLAGATVVLLLTAMLAFDRRDVGV